MKLYYFELVISFLTMTADVTMKAMIRPSSIVEFLLFAKLIE
ncbi:hypothetical protein QWZ16_18625 [Vibrio ostreicida]|uniref:Uncharacterized protein n=1 Tax=Vibrio ostreicida TaxID=526588 RepID=A0ABT8BZS9_9VIBR|nr:hypothetical protein [Vibrio ostreicida]MDN3611617.1 hypothetical protein [Vibrio ostreicida]